MRNKDIKSLKAEDFRRLTGVKAETFAVMLEVVNKAIKIKKAKGGRPNKLTCEQMLLMNT
jgi:hypothetical protein